MLAVAEAAMPHDPAGLLRRVGEDDPEAIAAAIRWLDDDPFVWDSGYYKQKLLRRVCRATLNPEDLAALRALVLQSCHRGPRLEFPEVVRLAVRLDDPRLPVTVGTALG